jgi:hypothetical protein
MTRLKAEPGSTVQVSARIDKHIYDELQHLSVTQDRSLSWTVARVLKEWFEARVKRNVRD